MTTTPDRDVRELEHERDQLALALAVAIRIGEQLQRRLDEGLALLVSELDAALDDEQAEKLERILRDT